MPFTFSHPAIVLPITQLTNKWVSATGLIIGSLTPDFEYFLRMNIKSNFSHTINGLFWFDLPLGILLTFVFHNIVRDSLINNLPLTLKSRFITSNHFDWNGYFKNYWYIVLTSILIGAASHILWDSFTHFHGYFVQKIPALQESVNLLGAQIPIFKTLQHGSTLIGGLIIIISIYKIPTNKSVNEKLNIKYWLILAGLTLSVISVKLLFYGLDLRLYGIVIVTAISGVLLSLVLTPVILSKKMIATKTKLRLKKLFRRDSNINS